MTNKNAKGIIFTFSLQFCTLIFAFSIFPSLVSASSLYIDTKHSEFFVGDTILFSVRIDSEGKNINAVEGEVLLDHAADAVSLIDINTSGSQFSLWPVNPLPSEHNARISFAGGSPGGLTSNNAIVFNVVLKLNKTGQVALSFDNIGAYINDGKGTKDEVRVKDLVIDVLPNKSAAKATDDWSTIILNDTTAPEPFEVYLGQEESVFDGKKFLSFGTTDGQSGVSYYEVTEGNLPPARSNGTYVLQEQNKPVKVVVIAYDSAGNARESVYNGPAQAPAPNDISYPIAIIVLMGVMVFIILLIVTYNKRQKA
jgi:hypothetical protein